MRDHMFKSGGKEIIFTEYGKVPDKPSKWLNLMINHMMMHENTLEYTRNIK